MHVMRKTHFNQSGFSVIELLLAILVVAALAVTDLVVYQHHKPISAKNSAATSTTQMNTPPKSTTTTQPAQANAGLTQYTNDKYGISFYYPNDWRAEERNPATSSPDTEKTELALWLVDTTAKTRPETAVILVSSRDLASEASIYGSSVGAPDTQQLTLKGKSAIKYTIPQSPTVNRIMYFIAVGTKTYSVQTYYEETNLARTPDYMTKFNNLVNY